jgi:hypothetical protein
MFDDDATTSTYSCQTFELVNTPDGEPPTMHRTPAGGT